MRVGCFVAGKKARAEAEQRAAAAEAELKKVRSQLGVRVSQLEGELSQRLHDARSTAEERLEHHTEAYRAQVRKILAQKHPITFD
jgi:F0F1-type ATP synthase membrane subunit b/b'